MRIELHAEHLTVEYGWAHHRVQDDGVLLCRYPSTGHDNDEVLIIGSASDLREIASAIEAMADEMDDA